MPKKTKREKVIAEYHRKLSGVGLRPQETVKSYTYAYRNSVKPSDDSTESAQLNDRSIRRDLFKTLILAVVAIAGEVAISMIINEL